MKMRKNKRIFIIAEAGVNHNGRLDIAKKMIAAAAAAGCDAVKFQTFKAEKLVSRYSPKAEYQRGPTDKRESQLKMLKKLELDARAHRELINNCKKSNIAFLSSPFDAESIDLLNRIGVEIFKIPSGEITNLPYLRKIGSLRKKVILSSGMATLAEVNAALNILTKKGTPKKEITVLHCTSEYPTPLKEVNLLAMCTIKNTLGVNVGYSDHTLGIEVPIAAAALGASTIEKHFTLDRNMNGPDHKASLEPPELKEMVIAIRNITQALGSGVKRPSPSEAKNKAVVRKSLVAARYIKEGEPFGSENITTKRPATGISPIKWDEVIGKVAKRDFKKDELIAL